MKNQRVHTVQAEAEVPLIIDLMHQMVLVQAMAEASVPAMVQSIIINLKLEKARKVRMVQTKRVRVQLNNKTTKDVVVRV